MMIYQIQVWVIASWDATYKQFYFSEIRLWKWLAQCRSIHTLSYYVFAWECIALVSFHSNIYLLLTKCNMKYCGWYSKECEAKAQWTLHLRWLQGQSIYAFFFFTILRYAMVCNFNNILWEIEMKGLTIWYGVLCLLKEKKSA